MRASNGISFVGRLARDARLALRGGPDDLPLPPRRLALLPGKAPGTPHQDLYVLRKPPT